jgi:phenylacetate-CoA ligase
MSDTPKLPFENRIWAAAETMTDNQRRKLQLQRLQSVVRRVSEVPFYKEALAKHHVSASAIKSLDDLRRLPFTTKADLRDHYPLGLLAVPREKIARIHGSSGTTGKPTFVAYTAKDRELWSDMCARFLVAGGLRPNHLVHICFEYGLFTGGFGLHYGVEKVGAAVVPVSSGNTPRQIMILKDLQPDVLLCTPSYALNLSEGARAAGVDPKSLSLRFAHLGGEPWTEDLRVKIEKELPLKAFNNYGPSEVIGPGGSGECVYRDGKHIQDDHFLVECLDPDTLEPVPDGQPGELVFTTLTKEAMPLLRYRTRDIAALDRKPCRCGRTTVRMGPVVGRRP